MTTLNNKLDKLEDKDLSTSLLENYNYLTSIFKNCSDVVYRKLYVGESKIKAIVIYIKSISEITMLSDNVINPIINSQNSKLSLDANGESFEYIKTKILGTLDYEETKKFKDLTYELLLGNSIFLLDGSNTCLIISSVGGKDRNIVDAASESVLRGPRDGFTEAIQTNIGLIRRRIKTPELKFETNIIGKFTKTQVVVTYIQNIVNENVLIELRKRLNSIEIDSILESLYIEELIEDQPCSLVPQIEHTERPDKVAADILEGRIGILVDGTPIALIVPTLAMQLLQSSEDYYQRYIYSYLIRIVRFCCLVIALLAPSLYVAATTFHQELIPTPILISIGSAREGIPFPTVLEVLMLDFTLEALREAGMRLPSSIGQSISFVGAIVIGDAAVKAKLASPATVIIVALTAIASFSITSYDLGLGLRMLRFILTCSAGVFGLFGISMVMIIFIVHILSLNSFGIPYFSPIAPLKLKDIKDIFTRVSWRSMTERPKSIGSKNSIRQKSNKKS